MDEVRSLSAEGIAGTTSPSPDTILTRPRIVVAVTSMRGSLDSGPGATSLIARARNDVPSSTTRVPGGTTRFTVPSRQVTDISTTGRPVVSTSRRSKLERPNAVSTSTSSVRCQRAVRCVDPSTVRMAL